MGDAYPWRNFIELKGFLGTQKQTPLLTFTYHRLCAAMKALYPSFPQEPSTQEALVSCSPALIARALLVGHTMPPSKNGPEANLLH